MAETEERVAAAEDVARRWGRLGVHFVVVHGLEGYPERIGRDLDILMPQLLAPWALREARQILADAGWPFAACPPSLWGDRLVALRFLGSDTSYLELHTMERLRWAVLEFGTWRSQPTHHLGPFPVHVGLTFCKAVLQPLLTGDLDRFKAGYLDNLLLREELDRVTEYLQPLLGTELAKSVTEAARQRNITSLLMNGPAVRRACAARMLGDLRGALHMTPEFLGRKMGRLMRVAGARIEIYATAESGRDDFLESFVRELRPVFLEVRIVRGKPARGERLRQQYHVLARQGAVLEVAHSPTTNPGLVLTYQGFSKHFDTSKGYHSDAVARQAARWVIENWLIAFACG